MKPGSVIRLSIPASAGSFNPEYVSGFQFQVDLGVQGLLASLSDQEVDSGLSGQSAGQSVRSPFSPVGNYGQVNRHLELIFPDQPITTPASARNRQSFF